MNITSDTPVAGDRRPPHHPDIPAPRIGVLLVNLGTPDAPTPGAVRRYLAEFLSDTRIVDYPRAFWLPLLHGVILNVRPGKTAKAYRSIWREESNESPLRYFTRRQAELLQEKLGEDCVVEWAMRYGSPSVQQKIEALMNAGCDRIFVLPLYPQYSATTTGSVHDAVFAAVQKMRWQPALRTAPAYHDEPAYIAALADVTRTHLQSLDWAPERVVLSFHGLPQRFFDEGDPYYCHCAKTARLLRDEMNWDETFAPLTFQSKFGPEKWLGPATDETLIELGRQNVEHIAVLTPGFVSDCIETLEEIGIMGEQSYMKAGGKNFSAIPCLNDSGAMASLLESIARREIAGWNT